MPKADAAGDTAEACGNGKLPQSQRPGGKKRMVAMFVAFVGAGYSVSASAPDLPHLGCSLSHTAYAQYMPPSSDRPHADELISSVRCQGMQYNPGIRTIEGELCRAMCAAGCISPQNARDPTKVCKHLLTASKLSLTSRQPVKAVSHLCVWASVVFGVGDRRWHAGELATRSQDGQGRQCGGQRRVAQADDRLPGCCAAHQRSPA